MSKKLPSNSPWPVRPYAVRGKNFIFGREKTLIFFFKSTPNIPNQPYLPALVSHLKKIIWRKQCQKFHPDPTKIFTPTPAQLYPEKLIWRFRVFSKKAEFKQMDNLVCQVFLQKYTCGEARKNWNWERNENFDLSIGIHAILVRPRLPL